METFPVPSRDLRLELRIKNNALWKAIHDRYPSTAEFCRQAKKCGFYLDPARVSGLITFRGSPFNKDGTYREECQTLATVLGIEAEGLFPRALYENVQDKTGLHVREVDSQQLLTTDLGSKLRSLSAPGRSVLDDLVQREEPPLVDQMGDRVTELNHRERAVLTLRFGLEGEKEKTLEQVGQVIGISKERVRRIQNEALQKLRRSITE
jgi:RNA polymerase sigma factor (sigma-70 family)